MFCLRMYMFSHEIAIIIINGDIPQNIWPLHSSQVDSHFFKLVITWQALTDTCMTLQLHAAHVLQYCRYLCESISEDLYGRKRNNLIRNSLEYLPTQTLNHAIITGPTVSLYTLAYRKQLIWSQRSDNDGTCCLAVHRRHQNRGRRDYFEWRKLLTTPLIVAPSLGPSMPDTSISTAFLFLAISLETCTRARISLTFSIQCNINVGCYTLVQCIHVTHTLAQARPHTEIAD